MSQFATNDEIIESLRGDLLLINSLLLSERAAHKWTHKMLTLSQSQYIQCIKDRDDYEEQLRHSREVSTALLSALKPIANKYFKEGEGTRPYDVAVLIDGEHVLAARAAIALAERDSSVIEESE